MQTPGKSETTTHHNLACPACGLLCDDVTVTRGPDGTLGTVQSHCARSVRFFEQAPAETSPRVGGKTVTLQAAAQEAARLLAGANQPLFAGLGTEVQGMRALLRLADRTGAALDHMYSDNSLKNTLVVQNSGWLVTTLTEVRNRVDLLLAVGTDIVSVNPRFFERQVWNRETLFGQDTTVREVVYLGGRGLDTTAGISPAGVKPTVLECDTARLPEVVAALRALVSGKTLVADEVAGIPLAALAALADRLRRASYGVVAWAASAFDYAHAELTVQNLAGMVLELNRSTRAAGLPLGGSAGDYSVNQVSAWISGYPVRNTFRQGYPEYDPYLYSAARQLQSGEADTLLWVSSFNAESAPPKTNIPTIVLGHGASTFGREPEVFIPIGVPGLDHAGTMFRMDSSVTLPLTKLRASKLPSLAEAVAAIEAAMTQDQQHAD